MIVHISIFTLLPVAATAHSCFGRFGCLFWRECWRRGGGGSMMDVCASKRSRMGEGMCGPLLWWGGRGVLKEFQIKNELKRVLSLIHI